MISSTMPSAKYSCSGSMHLERDDRGDYKNMIVVNGTTIRNPIREEIVAVRGLIPGEYVINVHHYLATTPDPVPVAVRVEKINPKVEVVFYDRLTLDHTGDEKTAVRFTIGEDGKIADINTHPKSLIRETRKVRSNIPTTGAALRQ
jgi:hypothetical protein